LRVYANPKSEEGFVPAEGLVVDSPQDEGCSPIYPTPSPKIEDPPQEEWGTKGVETQL
jgi:hypothetical protein